MNKKIIGVVVALVVLIGCGDKQNDVTEQGNRHPSAAAAIFNCEGEVVQADFNNDVEPQTINLFVQGAKMTLPSVESGSGAKYSDGEVTFWTHQGEATLSMEGTGQSLNCVETTAKNENAIVDENGNTVTEGCKTWFDGCNTCQVGDAGTPMTCTRMLCDPTTLKPTKCMDEELISQEK